MTVFQRIWVFACLLIMAAFFAIFFFEYKGAPKEASNRLAIPFHTKTPLTNEAIGEAAQEHVVGLYIRQSRSPGLAIIFGALMPFGILAISGFLLLHKSSGKASNEAETGPENNADEETDQEDPSKDAVSHFENYQEYNKTLRTWFVTFGLGAPSLFLLNDDLGKILMNSGYARWVVALYLLGSAIQIFITVLNKFIAWYSYYTAQYPQDEKIKNTIRYKILHGMGNDFRIDMAADLVTALFYLAAVVISFSVFAYR